MKTKRIIASALAFIMATTAAASSVFAAGETVTISASKTEASAGSSFSVDISFSGVPATAIQSCEFAIKYDSSVLSITGVDAGEITNTGADNAESDISGDCPAFFEDHSVNGTINMTWCTGLEDKNYWISEDGVFATISGTVASGAAAGEYPIEIVAISRDDLNGTNDSIYAGYVENESAVEYSTSVANGAVIIVGETQVTTTGTTTTTNSIEISDVLYGDTNLDGVVTLVDLVYLNKRLSNAVKFNAQQEANADCKKDGEIVSSDATALLKFLGEKISALPE